MADPMTEASVHCTRLARCWQLLHHHVIVHDEAATDVGAEVRAEGEAGAEVGANGAVIVAVYAETNAGGRRGASL